MDLPHYDYPVVPEFIHNPNEATHYQKKKFLRKGYYSKTYEFRRHRERSRIHIKIFSNRAVGSEDFPKFEDIASGITINKEMIHRNILLIYWSFEDERNLYCNIEPHHRIRLLEMYLYRRSITYYECHYYIYQILDAVRFLHSNRIIHRNLSLESVLLNENLNVKITDFSFATRVEFVGERKETLCTFMKCNKNIVIAPEMRYNYIHGHSYEVDIWSIGFIMYTLLFGEEPFILKTAVSKPKYNKQTCLHHATEYEVLRLPSQINIWLNIPSQINKRANEMIFDMLKEQYTERPNIGQLFNYEFITHLYPQMPKQLPLPCISTAPRNDQNNYCVAVGQPEYVAGQLPLNFGERVPSYNAGIIPCHLLESLPLMDNSVLNSDVETINREIIGKPTKNDVLMSSPFTLHNLKYRRDIVKLEYHLSILLDFKKLHYTANYDIEQSDPEKGALFWITNWRDCSDRHGFEYLLCDNSAGVLFNDSTKLIILSNGINVHYIDQENRELYMKVHEYPPPLKNKMDILLNYYIAVTGTKMPTMLQHAIDQDPGDTLSRIPHLCTWFRTSIGVVMHLTNGSVQLNLIHKKEKAAMILCPKMRAVTYIVGRREPFKRYAYRFNTLIKIGLSVHLHLKLAYARLQIQKLLELLLKA